MSRQVLTKEEVVEAKRERVPVHESREKLSLRGLDHENFHYRFVNMNEPDRVFRFTEAGYTIVQRGGSFVVGDTAVDSAKHVGSQVQKSGGKGVLLGLMCIPKKFYEQDQLDKEKHVRELENDMYRQLQEQSDPRKGNYGSVDNFGTVRGTPRRAS